MKIVIVCCLMALTSIGNAMSIDEHILVNYPLIITNLKEQGFRGPFGEELAKYALIRQIIEDGSTRSHSVSIVGMSVGEPHTSILKSLGLNLGTTGEGGMCLKKITSNENETFYAVYGPRANVCSATAIALLWDQYVNNNQKHRFGHEENTTWNASKNISWHFSCDTFSRADIAFYDSMTSMRNKVFQKVNYIYSSTAASTINSLVANYATLFEFAKGKVVKD